MSEQSHTPSENFKTWVKRNVADNFDCSYRQYQAFEDRHRFFYTLTLKLAENIQLQPNSMVLDVGCGTGISALALNEHFACRVLGVDLSEKMVAAGCSMSSCPDIRLEVGDGECLSELANGQLFNYVLYNASIFIMPDVDKTFQEAYACLETGGKIAYSFYPELEGPEGEDLLAVAFDRRGEPMPRYKVVTDYERAGSALKKVYGNITHHRWERSLDLEFIRDFFLFRPSRPVCFPAWITQAA